MSRNALPAPAIDVSADAAPHFLKSRWASVHIATLALGLAIVTAGTLPADLGLAVAAEHGPLEVLQASLLFSLAIGVWFFRRRGESLLTTSSLTIVLWGMGARELEWHKAWTRSSILKPRFYLGPSPPGAKLLAGIVVLLVVAAAAYLLQRHLRGLWLGLRQREPLAITFATFFAVLVLSRVLDKSRFGHAPGPTMVAARVIIEEVLELVLPLLVLLGAFQRQEAYAELPATRSAPEVTGRTATNG
jgi:hypothetical protein